MRLSFQNYLFWGCFITILISNTLSYRIQGNYLYDLESTTFNDLQTEAANWKPSNLVDTVGNTKVSTCAGVNILGGYNVLDSETADNIFQYFRTNYAKLPSHTYITAKFKLYAIDEWDGDKFFVIIDGRIVDGLIINHNYDASAADICGDSTIVDSLPIDIEVTMRHNSSSLWFMIGYLSADSKVQSLGLRDLQIKFSFNYIEYPNLCGRTNYSLGDGACKCDDYYYEDPSENGQCLACASSCLKCSGPDSNQCTSCASGQYITPDKQCFSSCSFPYRLINNDTGVFCDVPCADSTQYYNVEFETCTTGCVSPYSIDSTGAYLKCIIPSARSGGFLWAPSTPGSVSVVVFNKLMQYVRYLDIDRPPRLERIAKGRGRMLISVKSNVDLPETNDANYGLSSLPYIFKARALSPSFLVNYFNTLVTLWIAIFCGVAFTLLERAFKHLEMPFWYSLSRRLRSITRWNFFLMVLLANIDEVILYASLEFRTSFVRGGTILSVVSFIAALLFIFMVSFSAWRSYQVVKKFKTDVAPSERNLISGDAFAAKRESTQIFYKGFNSERSPNEYFYLIYVLRIAVPTLIQAMAYNVPILVGIVEILVNIVILIYILYMKPFQKLVNHVQLATFEFIVLVMNICVMGLIFMDAGGNSNVDTMATLGDIVIIGTNIINILVIIFLVAKIYLEFVAVYNATNIDSSSKIMKIPHYTQAVAAIFLQQSCMGFEELLPTRSSYPSKAIMGPDPKEMELQKGSRPSFDKSSSSIQKLVKRDSLDQNRNNSRAETIRSMVSSWRKSPSPVETVTDFNSPQRNPRKESNISDLDLSPNISDPNRRLNFRKTSVPKSKVINLHELEP